MKIGDKKTFIDIPSLGFVEAGETMEETMENIRRAEVKLELENKKLRKLLSKGPGKHWIISEDPPE